jgi:hypothetical protein
MVARMVKRVLIERILADIKSNVKVLRDANDITWDIYRTDVRARRFVERTPSLIFSVNSVGSNEVGESTIF